MTTSALNRAELGTIASVIAQAVALESRERGYSVDRHDKGVLERVCACVAQTGAQWRREAERG